VSAFSERPELPPMALDGRAPGPLADLPGDLSGAVHGASAGLARAVASLLALGWAYPLISVPLALLAALSLALATGVIRARPGRSRRSGPSTRDGPAEKGGARTQRPPNPAGA
jgi:hypothetical protein